MKRFLSWWLSLLSLVLIDQGIKQIVILFNLNRVVNKGVAFGLLPQVSWYVFLGTFIAVLIISSKDRLASLLILGGGLSNLVDRFFHRGVVDYVYLPFLPVFNLADVLVILGSLKLIYSFSRDEKGQDSLSR